jgi:cathepsin L
MIRIALIATLIVLFGVLAFAIPTKYDLNQQPEAIVSQWIKNNGKAYKASEKAARENNIKASIARVKTLNQQSKDGVVYDLGSNADLTDDEFFAWRLGGRAPKSPSKRSAEGIEGLEEILDVSALPTSINWVAKGKVKPPRNQGNCGCCWAFAATGAIEARWAIKKGIAASNQPALSEQHLIDCDTKSMGCNGGYSSRAMEYVVRKGGHYKRSKYVWAGVKRTCQSYASSYFGAKLAAPGAVVYNNNYAAMMNWLATKGPIVAMVDARKWKYYNSGIMRDCGTAVNHSILIVGYGKTSSGVAYWRVKNSWGTGWGSGGYILVKRSSTGGGACGIGQWAIGPTL